MRTDTQTIRKDAQNMVREGIVDLLRFSSIQLAEIAQDGIRYGLDQYNEGLALGGHSPVTCISYDAQKARIIIINGSIVPVPLELPGGHAAAKHYRQAAQEFVSIASAYVPASAEHFASMKASRIERECI